MDDEWDLHAVVRSCTSATGAAAAAVNNTPEDDYDDGFYDFETPAAGNDSNPCSYPTFGENPSDISGGLEDVYKEGCGRPLPTATAAIDRGGFGHEPLPMLQDSHLSFAHTINSQSIRTRKRKNQEKKVVFKWTQEELNNDTWAWRKYGQKPIKGSPYPRNYYRCSTTKACGARKQVERSPMDPTVFIVSYSGEHVHPRPTHRSSLAGSTRSNKFNIDNNKPRVSVNTAATMLEHPPCSSSSPASASSFSPTTSVKEDECEIDDEDEYDQDILIPNVVVNEELLKRFQELNDGGGGSGSGSGGSF